MSAQHHYRGGFNPRVSRPNLTLDTQASPTSNSSGDGPGVVSAPVGTRQEQGVAPLHQIGDRHVAKLAEMMESPTWRSQNPGPHVRSDAPALSYNQAHLGSDIRNGAPALRHINQTQIHGSYVRTEAAGLGFSKVRENNSRAAHATGQALQSYQTRQPAPTAEDLRLGLSPVGHEVKVLGIQPFPKTPETSDNTFIISATVSQQRFMEQAKRLHLQEHFIDAGKKSQKNGGNAAITSQAPAAHSDGGVHINCRDEPQNRGPIGALKTGLEHSSKDVHIAMEPGKISWSNDRSQRSTKETPEDTERFNKMMNRLKPGRNQQESAEKTSPVDPAILSFKKAGPSTPHKSDDISRVRSDSGYTSLHSRFNSLSMSTQPSTRASMSGSTRPSICGGEASGSADTEDSPSKSSMLNPAAKEFAIAKSNNASPAKQGVLGRPTIFTPAQQVQGMMGGVPQPQISPMQPLQGPWLTPLASQYAQAAPQHPQAPHYPRVPQYPQAAQHNPQVAVLNQALMQQLESMQLDAMNQHAMLQSAMPRAMPQGPMLTPIQQGALPGTLPNWGNLPGQVVPTMTSINTMTPSLMSLSQPSGLGHASMGSSPAHVHTNSASPFHQQLDAITLPQCYVPAQQNMSSYAGLAPAAPLAGIAAPQNTGSIGSQTVLTASAAPFIPKHVPKPKVPNTTGQQNWELMHELRRMNEPGYAQKCKEKQKRRFQKQLERTGGQS